MKGNNSDPPNSYWVKLNVDGWEEKYASFFLVFLDTAGHFKIAKIIWSSKIFMYIWHDERIWIITKILWVLLVLFIFRVYNFVTLPHLFLPSMLIALLRFWKFICCCCCFTFQSAIPQKGSEVNLTLGGIDLNNSGRLACFLKLFWRSSCSCYREGS